MEQTKGPIQGGEIPCGAKVADHHVACARFGILRNKLDAFKGRLSRRAQEQRRRPVVSSAQPVGGHFARGKDRLRLGGNAEPQEFGGEFARAP